MWSPRDNHQRSHPLDTRPNVQQVLGVGVPLVSSQLTTIPEEPEVVDPVVSQPMDTDSTTRSRQLESEPGSELVEINVRPRVGSEVSEHRVNSGEEQPVTVTEVGILSGSTTISTLSEKV